MILQRIGYWGDERDGFPRPEQLVDTNWAEEERDDVAIYLMHGLVAAGYMGYAFCRMCGEQLGNLELTDGVFAWPEGLDHYLWSHGVRLPAWFVEHVRSMMDTLEDASISDDRWKQYAVEVMYG